MAAKKAGKRRVRRVRKRTATVRKAVGKKSSKPRRNPARRTNHHLEGSVKLSDRVEAVLYRHSGSRTHAPYKHTFGAGVQLLGLRDGTVLLRSTKPLWSMHTVRDDE